MDGESDWRSIPLDRREGEHTVPSTSGRIGQMGHFALSLTTLREMAKSIPGNVPVLVEGEDDAGYPGLRDAKHVRADPSGAFFVVSALTLDDAAKHGMPGIPKTHLGPATAVRKSRVCVRTIVELRDVQTARVVPVAENGWYLPPGHFLSKVDTTFHYRNHVNDVTERGIPLTFNPTGVMAAFLDQRKDEK